MHKCSWIKKTKQTELKLLKSCYLKNILITDVETDGVSGDTEALAVPHVLQWMTGQSHIPILSDEKRHFKITCNFDHECRETLGDHLVCYPTVSAYTQTVTFSSAAP